MISMDQLGDALSFIIKDDSVFNQLQNDFSTILADLVTFKNNPNCTCRGRVIKFFTEQLEKDPLVMNKYVKDPNALKTEMDKIKAERQNNNYAGRMFVIPKGEESWQNFASTLPGKMFRMFSIVERDDGVVVYFL
jgi:hypothetical protein